MDLTEDLMLTLSNAILPFVMVESTANYRSVSKKQWKQYKSFIRFQEWFYGD